MRRLSRDASSADGAADAERDAPPCTDFDVAYFQSYSHLGIHEEMIKVSFPLSYSIPLIVLLLFMIIQFN